MKKIIIISLLITCLVMVGCGEVEQEPIIDIDYNDLGVIESDDDCPDHLEECKKQLEEVDAFEYEFECDKWEKTGITLYKDGHCKHYKIYEDGNWYESYPNNEFSEKEKQLVGICNDKVNEEYKKYNGSYSYNKIYEWTSACIESERFHYMRYEMEIRKCIDVPYAEEVCVHKKVVGLNKK